MRTIFLTIIVLSFLGTAYAHSPSPNGNCNNVGDETLSVAGVKVGLVVEDVLSVYVAPDLSIWSESNGHAGLQTHDHLCRLNGNYVTIVADEPTSV